MADGGARLAPDFRGGRGARSVALAAWLLGLKHPGGARATVRPVALFQQDDPPRLVITLATVDGEADVSIEPRDDARPALVRTAHLALGHAARRCLPAVARVLRHAAARLDGAPYEALLALLDAGGGEGRAERCPAAAPPERPAVQGPAQPRGLHRDRGHPADVARFVLRPDELRRVRQTMLFGALPWARVLHGDAECHGTGGTTFFAAPWPVTQAERRDASPFLNLTTDLRETDVIGGTVGRLAAALEALRTAAHPPGVVMINTTCVPDLTGDDHEAPVRALRAATGWQVEHARAADRAAEPRSRAAVLGGLVPPPPEDADAGAVDLIGFAGAPGLPDLLRRLAAADVRVGAVLLPQITAAAAARVGRARTRVLCGQGWAELAPALAGAPDTATVALPPPFGWDGAFAWLAAVAALAGREGAMAAELEAARAALGPAWARGRERAARHAVGFVGTADELRELEEPRDPFRLPVIPLVRELGFPVETLVVGDGVAPEDWSERLAARVVYTEFTHDTRLVRAGRTPLVPGVFELGPEGALRAQERLLDLATLTFYRRFGRA